jgi:hypothetical protein
MSGTGEHEMNERKPPDKPDTMEVRPIAKRKEQGALGREVQAKIGQQLRAYYDGLVEPTPDRFVDLLKQLDKPTEKGSPE